MPETATYDPNGVIAGDYPIVTKSEIIVTGQNLAANAVLGRITASGKLRLSLTASNDGSQVPCAILAEAVDASAGDAAGPVFLTGEFDGAKLVYGAGHTAATVETAFRASAQSIFIRTLA